MPSDRILVVDDEEAIREIVTSMLASARFGTCQASSGTEALALLQSGEEFDLVLSDLMMAGMDGLALLERTKEKYPDVPVVMVTAVHDIQAALQAIRNGAYDYLLKPFEREQLLATVHRALENRRLKRENDAYRTNLEALVAARTQQLKSAMGDLKRSYNITIEALGDVLDYKDAETEGHSRRVTTFTIAMAKQMGLSKEDIETIAFGAFLHDIGKVKIPDAILTKPGKLTAAEYEHMKEHCYLGYKLLNKIPFLGQAAEIVYAHQEYFDGTGYPRGLKGEEIPLGARIFAIADTLDAITSDRPYRRKRSLKEAKDEIKRCSGTQFDPRMVELFLKIPDPLWDDLRRQVEEQRSPFLAELAATARTSN
jgi:putative nucleotidyltransferase with HDIG domain